MNKKLGSSVSPGTFDVALGLVTELAAASGCSSQASTADALNKLKSAPALSRGATARMGAA